MLNDKVTRELLDNIDFASFHAVLPALIKLTRENKLLWVSLVSLSITKQEKPMAVALSEVMAGADQSFQMDRTKSFYAHYKGGDIVYANNSDCSDPMMFVSVGSPTSLLPIPYKDETDPIYSLYQELTACIYEQMRLGNLNPLILCKNFINTLIEDAQLPS